MHQAEEIVKAAQFFGYDTSDAMTEWVSWIEFIKEIKFDSTFNSQTPLVRLSKLVLEDCDRSASLRETFPILSKLYAVASSLALSSAEVERLFSHLKLIKSDRRASLGNRRLVQLLNIKLNSEDSLWEEVKKLACQKWLSMADRRVKFFC